MNFIISIPRKEDEYAERFSKNVPAESVVIFWVKL